MSVDNRKSPLELIEGTDYYIESGRWVFTAAYLLRRGTCCDTGCRHCPYQNQRGKRPKQPDAMTPDGSEQ